MSDLELGLELSGTYAPTYSSNDDACLDAVDRADISSDEFWGNVTDYFDNSNTTFGDVFQSGMDSWGDADRVEEVCDTGGMF